MIWATICAVLNYVQNDLVSGFNETIQISFNNIKNNFTI